MFISKLSIGIDLYLSTGIMQCARLALETAWMLVTLAHSPSSQSDNQTNDFAISSKSHTSHTVQLLFRNRLKELIIIIRIIIIIMTMNVMILI